MDSAHSSLVQVKIGGEFKLADRNAGKGFGFRVQGAENFASGGVAMCVQNAIAAVCALPAKSKFGALAVELRAPLDQLLNAIGGIFDKDGCRLRVTQAVAGVERVLQMKADFIFIAERSGDPALCPLGGRIRNLPLGQYDYAAGIG
jgi:hypothetical protein